MSQKLEAILLVFISSKIISFCYGGTLKRGGFNVSLTNDQGIATHRISVACHLVSEIVQGQPPAHHPEQRGGELAGLWVRPQLHQRVQHRLEQLRVLHAPSLC